MNNENGFVIWFTGLSGSGKTTLANLLKSKIESYGFKVQLLDGDIIRGWEGFASGFTRPERENHLKRIAYIAKLLSSHGIIVIVSCITPYNNIREFVRHLLTRSVLVYVECSITTCKERDIKGLYKKVEDGSIKYFTGIDDPFEIPSNPTITVNSENQTKHQEIESILSYLYLSNYLPKL